eukprot:UN04733
MSVLNDTNHHALTSQHSQHSQQQQQKYGNQQQQKSVFGSSHRYINTSVHAEKLNHMSRKRTLNHLYQLNGGDNHHVNGHGHSMMNNRRRNIIFPPVSKKPYPLQPT